MSMSPQINRVSDTITLALYFQNYEVHRTRTSGQIEQTLQRQTNNNKNVPRC